MVAQERTDAGPGMKTGVDGLPTIAADTPYPQVRTAMLAAGFHAPRVLKRADHMHVPCGPYGAFDQCSKWPEILYCSATSHCWFAFRAPDGRWAIIETFGDNDLQMCWCLDAVRWAEPGELDGYAFSASPSDQVVRPAP